MKQLMMRAFIVAIVSSCVIVLTPWARDSVGTQAGSQPAPTRIISLVPAVSEMLFAIGAGPQVVAVSSFDDYPPEVLKLPRVGALLDPDLERILSLRPDLVIVYESQVDLRRQLERASIPTFVYKHAALADVTATIRQLGARVGRDEGAAAASRPHRREARGHPGDGLPAGPDRRRCSSLAAMRSRCAASTPAAASASSTTC